MAIDCDSFSFADLLTNVVDNRGKTCPVSDSGLPLIATNCVKNDTLHPVFEKVRYVSQETYENWFRGHPMPGDLIFVCKGSPGNVCWTPDPVEFCIAQDMVAVRANEKIVDSKFLFALLRNQATQNQILNMHVGTLIPHFKKGDFKNLFLDIPKDRKIQEFIGETYFDFCNKIELNRRMNSTLESMANGKFRSWFVDFDPVIDKARAAGIPIPESLKIKAQSRRQLGNPYKTLPSDIEELFPDSFQFNEQLGWIPKGWTAQPIGELIGLLNGHPFKSQDYVSDGEYGVVTIKNVQARKFEPSCSNRISKLPEKMKDWCLLNPGDVLLSLTGNVGRVCFVPGGKYVQNQRVAKLSPQSELENSFAYFYFQQGNLYEEMLTIAKGTAQQNLSPVETAKITRPMPTDKRLFHLASKLLDPYFVSLIQNTKHSQTLAELRDALLPKLLSGDLKIPAAEKLVAENL